MASFALVNPTLKHYRNKFETLSEMSVEELMLEVELLRITDQAIRKSNINNYEIRVSSSELLDALFEECEIELVQRIRLLQLIYRIFSSNTSNFTRSQ